MEADLLEDISPRAELLNFTKTNSQSRVAELCKDVAKFNSIIDNTGVVVANC